MGCYQRKLAKGLRWYYRGQYLGKKYVSKAIYLNKRACKEAEAQKFDDLVREASDPKTDVGLLELFNHRLDMLLLIRNKEYYEDCKRLSSPTRRRGPICLPVTLDFRPQSNSHAPVSPFPEEMRTRCHRPVANQTSPYRHPSGCAARAILSLQRNRWDGT